MEAQQFLEICYLQSQRCCNNSALKLGLWTFSLQVKGPTAEATNSFILVTAQQLFQPRTAFVVAPNRNSPPYLHGSGSIVCILKTTLLDVVCYFFDKTTSLQRTVLTQHCKKLAIFWANFLRLKVLSCPAAGRGLLLLQEHCVYVNPVLVQHVHWVLRRALLRRLVPVPVQCGVHCPASHCSRHL
jgi:hypothetical protein